MSKGERKIEIGDKVECKVTRFGAWSIVTGKQIGRAHV